METARFVASDAVAALWSRIKNRYGASVLAERHAGARPLGVPRPAACAVRLPAQRGFVANSTGKTGCAR
jgi:hypothetical protein